MLKESPLPPIGSIIKFEEAKEYINNSNIIPGFYLVIGIEDGAIILDRNCGRDSFVDTIYLQNYITFSIKIISPINSGEGK